MAERSRLSAARHAAPSAPHPVHAAPDVPSRQGPASGKDEELRDDELDDLDELDEPDELDESEAPFPEPEIGIEEEAIGLGAEEDELDAPPEEGEDADPFDDAEATDLDLGGDSDGPADLDDEPVGDGAEAAGDAFGDDDGMDRFDDEGAEGDETGFELDESDAAEAPRDSEDDGGAEGMEASEELDPEDTELPLLDAGEGEGEEGDELAFADLLEPGLPRATARPWSPREGAGAHVPCSSVAAEGGLVAAAGEAALVVGGGELAARELALVGPCVDVAVADGAVYVATPRGAVVVSRDAGLSFAELPGVPGEDGSIALAATPGRVWLLSAGALWRLAAGGVATRVRAGVRAIAASGGTLVALVQEGGSVTVERVRGDDEASQASPAPVELGRATRDARLAAAREGRSIAIVASGVLHVSHDAGARYRTLDLPPVLAAAFVEDSGAASLPDCAVLSPDPASHAARLFVVASDGDVETAAVLPGFASPHASLAWDASRDALWIASASGLVAVERPRRH